MVTKTTIALSIALVMGAAPIAVADYEFDSSGAPVDMHIVDAQFDSFAAAGTPAEAAVAQARGSFSVHEKMLFDRTSRPYDQGEEQ
jgi:hypothetical protein